ncbi:terminase large subunit [Micromonospora craniellae]|uniref:Terminase large subunit n=1 Tax=Micromonospora craniellae TaxID=2294034 RepID=A0A372G1T2_9ACTN|nr:terminase TerL endonuclease subunit [Micromonospora craniellae]QOC89871.1 terminase large subunit [Micromonospora craniellae]RFS47015.1 terminase large subunit [Micromonospora craniellae]
MATRTRSAAREEDRSASSAEVPTAFLPPAEELERLKLSPEVAWYLVSRGIALPDCPPRWKTPEPRDVVDAAFDPDRVDHVLASFRQLRHTQGRLAGLPLIPDPWQVAYILAPVFGWVRWDEDAEAYVRIIRTLYVDVPRKNGKSTLCGGIAIYMACADGEQGAQVVTAATSERQAGFVFNPIKTLAAKSRALARFVKALAKKVIHKPSGSTIEVVSSAADAQHGANIHCGVVDELHVHKTPDLLEAIETGTGSRTQPLIVIITTADSGRRETAYDRKRRLVEQLASGVLVDETTYGVIWCADPEADPFAEATQRAANPGYGISPTRAYLRSKANGARNSPAELAAYQRLHLGVRTKQETKYLTLVSWDRNAGAVDEDALTGREAFGGLDLASTSDLIALCWLFPDDGGYDALWRLWTPEENVANLDKRTAKAASRWVKEGLLLTTPGNVADYDFVQAQIEQDIETFDVASLGYDPWNATQLTNNLSAAGAPLVKVRQGLQTLSPPLKEVQRLLLAGREDRPLLRHGGNPAVRWQVDNLSVHTDPAGNVKPDKARSAEKIDAVSSLVTAMSEAMGRAPTRRSAYADEGAELTVI